MIGSDGAEGAENGGRHWLAVAGGADDVFVPAALQAATVALDAEDDVVVGKLMRCANMDVCVPVLASLDGLGREVRGVELTGGGGGFCVHF